MTCTCSSASTWRAGPAFSRADAAGESSTTATSQRATRGGDVTERREGAIGVRMLALRRLAAIPGDAVALTGWPLAATARVKLRSTDCWARAAFR